MKEKKPQKQLFQFVMLSLLSVVSVLVMASPSLAVMDCSSCHGDGINPVTGQLRAGTDMRPVDSAFRNITTGGFVGNHRSHMPAAVAPSAVGAACVACHNNGTYTTGHRTGVIQLNAAVAYNKGAGNITFTNQTSVPVLGTCATASCHANPVGAGTVTTPSWAVSTAAGCTGCHIGTNAITATGPATGAHAKHGTTCTACHNAGTTATTAPTALHNDGSINLIAAVGYPTVSAKHAPGSGYTTCSTASCHNNPYAPAGSVVTPNWGATTVSGCVGCHTGAGAILASGPATGSHVKHDAHGTTCVACHNAGTTATTAPTTLHNTGTIDVVNVGYPAAVARHTINTGFSTCSNASCHPNPYGAGPVAATPTWGVETVAGCAACHTGANVITATGPATGGHNLHMLRATIACTNCHAPGTTATSSPTTGHLDTNIDVFNVGYPVSVVKHAAGSGYSNCSNVSCHNSPAGYLPVFTAAPVVWGGNLNCDGCHGFPPAGTNHTNVLPGTCNSCHSNVKAGIINTSTPAAAFVTLSLHMNGIVEGGKCNACHGYPPVQTVGTFGHLNNYTGAALQNYSGGGGVHSVAGHLALTTKPSDGFGLAGSVAPGCATCHPSGLTHNTGGGTFLTANVQVVVDPQFKFDKNRPIVYNAKQSGASKTTGTCANVSCHYQKSPVWSSQPYTQGH